MTLKYKLGDKVITRLFAKTGMHSSVPDGSVVTLTGTFSNDSRTPLGWYIDHNKSVGWWSEDWLEPLVKSKSGFGKFIRKIEDANGG